MLVSLDFTTLVANTVESQSGSDGSPYEKHVDTKGRVLSDKCIAEPSSVPRAVKNDCSPSPSAPTPDTIERLRSTRARVNVPTPTVEATVCGM